MDGVRGLSALGKAETSRRTSRSFARSAGSIHPLATDPGAYAPGFMPSRAPRAFLLSPNSTHFTTGLKVNTCDLVPSPASTVATKPPSEFLR